MVPYIKELSVNRKQWIDEETFKHGVALCQTLPGAIAVNVAAYVGMRARGISGMMATFTGFLLPAFFLLLIFSFVYYETHTLPAAVSVFTGLQVIVVAIIANAVLSFGKNALKEKKDIFIVIAGVIALLLKINPFFVIIAAAFIGIVLYNVQGLKMTSTPAGSSHYFKDASILLGCFSAGLALLLFWDKTLFDLAMVMTKVELFAFGGGYAALTLMFNEVVEVKAWLDSKTFMDGVALGQITPGPILITATFVGYLLKGLSGAIIGTLAIFLPCIILMTIVLPFFDRLRTSSIFLRAIKGIVTCFVGLLLFILIKFANGVAWNGVSILLWLGSFIAIYRKIDILYVVIAGAVISLFIF